MKFNAVADKIFIYANYASYCLAYGSKCIKHIRDIARDFPRWNPPSLDIIQADKPKSGSSDPVSVPEVEVVEDDTAIRSNG